MRRTVMRRKGETMKVIDFHMHPYFTEEECFCFYPDSFQPSPAQLQEDLAAAGIDQVCGSVIGNLHRYRPGDGFAYFQELNRKALQLREQFGDFYVPGFHIHPDFVKESIAEIEYMHAQGVHMVGELVPYMHGWRYSHENYSAILDAAEDHQMIVNYHTMPEDWEAMERMIETHPGITFVAAHPGEKGEYLHHIENLKKYRNHYLDLSGTGIFRYGMLAHGVMEVGAERFLFGTDYPICNPRMYVQAVMQEHITEEDRKKIFAENAQKLMNR